MREFLEGSRACPPGESLKTGPLRMHFQHSGAEIGVFEQNRRHDFKFWLIYLVTALEFCI